MRINRSSSSGRRRVGERGRKRERVRERERERKREREREKEKEQERENEREISIIFLNFEILDEIKRCSKNLPLIKGKLKFRVLMSPSF